MFIYTCINIASYIYKDIRMGDNDVGNIDKKTNEFILKAQEIHGEKFDYSLVVFKNYRTNVEIICRQHGQFSQNPHNHCKKGRTGCRDCGKEVQTEKKCMTLKVFEEKAKKIYPDYDYSRVIYVNHDTKVIIKCNEGHEFKQKPVSFLSKKRGCPKCNVAKGQMKRCSTIKRISNQK